MERIDVLVVGSGSTGLVLALTLARLGVRVRAVDSAAEPGAAARPLALHARSLEHYAQLALADALVRGGVEASAVNVWTRGEKKTRASFEDLGQEPSPYPYVLFHPRRRHDDLVRARLAQLGVDVAPGTELVHFEDEGARVVASLKRKDGVRETCAAEYLAACDGARSTVREALGVPFTGARYEPVIYFADVDARGPAVDGEIHIARGDEDFLGILPLGVGRVALLGSVRGPEETRPDAHRWPDLDSDIFRRVRLGITRINSFWTHRVEHRVADRFRINRAFLLGDAAHVMPPLGDGMNAAVGDAINLAWKLAACIHGRANARVLDTYEPERIAVARREVAESDRVFQVLTVRGGPAKLAHLLLAPGLVASLSSHRVVRRRVFDALAQLAINYRDSPLSDGAAERVRGGDRLPWLPSQNNFAPLRRLEWQVHVYGADPPPPYVSLCAERGLPLYVMPWTREAHAAGLAANAAYLVRPDGYLGLVDPEMSEGRLEAYLDAHGLRFLPRVEVRSPRARERAAAPRG